MAIIRTGSIVGDISGTVGSVVFVTGGRSTVVRPRPVTRHKSSRFLARTKSRMQVLRNHWSTLTTLQQDLWRTAAGDINRTNVLGQSSPMSGFSYFIMTSRVVFPGTFSIVDEPAALRARDTPVNPRVDFSVSIGFDVFIDNPSAPLPLQIQVYGWPFWIDHPTRSVPRLVFLDERTALTDPVADNVRPEWIDHFGNMVEGQRFTVGLKARDGASPFNPIAIIQSTVTA